MTAAQTLTLPLDLAPPRPARLKRPFIHRFGAKFRESGLYPPPRYSTIIEPFAGTAGYSCRYYDRRVILCDLDEKLVGAWRYLLRASASEILRIGDIPEGGTVADLGVCHEAQWLVGYWLERSRPYPAQRPGAFMRYGKDPGSFWGAAARQSIASQVDLIRHWDVRLCSYAEAPTSRGGATWFVDPPYDATVGDYYPHGRSGIDFAALADWCRSRPGQTIVCEAPGATWLPFRPMDIRRNLRGEKSLEGIWTSDLGDDA